MSFNRVLVTGGAGFIGSALAVRLIEEGYEVDVVDNLVTGDRGNVPSGASFVEGEISEEATFQRIDGEEIDAVFHLAAQSSGEKSFEDPRYDLNSHVVGTFNLLRWCTENEIERLVYASSMSVYGEPEYLPVDEDHPVSPKSYYGAGKLGAEAYVKLLNNHGMNNTILRLFTVYGPGQNLEDMKQGMVSIYLSYVLEGEELLIKGPIDRFRDFVYIDDVIDAWMQVFENSTTFGETYNVSRSIRVEVSELLNSILDVQGVSDYPIDVTDGTPGDQFGIYGESSKLQSHVGWTPEVTLEEGLEAMIEAEVPE